MARHVAILGGGIAGLATAFRLEEQARLAGLDLRITLLEKADRLGGKIRTDRVGPYLMEAGPDSLLNRKPWGMDLCRDLGLQGALAPSCDLPEKTFMLWRGNQVPLPPGMMLGIPTRLLPLATTPLVSWPGKLRALGDLFMRPRRMDQDESLADFFRRHFGEEVLERLVAPLLGGIYSGRADTLSLFATFPSFADLEARHGSLIRGMKKQALHPASSTSPFSSLRDGMQSLVTRITSQLVNTSLQTGQSVARLTAEPDGTWCLHLDGDGHPPMAADEVVIALPANVATRVMADLLPDTTEDLDGIPFTSSATVNLGFDTVIPDTVARGYGFLVAPIAEDQVAGGTWAMNKFEHRCEPGHSLLRLFFSGETEGNAASPDAWIEPALRFCRERLQIAVEPREVRVAVWHRTNPQYQVGHMERLERIQAAVQARPGLYITGSSLTGFSVSDCAKDAVRVARQVVGGT